jgi:hypothetical protein
MLLAPPKLAGAIARPQGAFSAPPASNTSTIPSPDREHPGRDLAAAVEGRRFLPHDQHRVVDDFLDRGAAARHAVQEAGQTRKIGAVQAFEGEPVPGRDTAKQVRFLVEQLVQALFSSVDGEYLQAATRFKTKCTTWAA